MSQDYEYDFDYNEILPDHTEQEQWESEFDTSSDSIESIREQFYGCDL